MKNIFRSLLAVVLAVGVAAQTAAVALGLSTTALIMGGTFHPLLEPRDKPDFVTAYLDNAVGSHLDPAFGATTGPVTNAVAVFTPEDFFPIGRLTFDRSVAEGGVNLRRCLAATSDCVYNADPAVTPEAGTAAPQPGDTMIVFGYSQSAVIASLAKAELIDGYQVGDSGVAFMLIANPMRPNGGVLMRLFGWPTIPLLEISFPGASPNAGPVLDNGEFVYPTVDVARQYDGLGGDFPVRPLNLVALVNSFLGYGLLHGETVNVPLDEARFQGRQGDTSYYLIETDLVPLLQPLAFFVPKPILSALDVPLRVIIEDAYERGIGPGTPTRMRLWPMGDPLRLLINLVTSIPVAADQLLDGFGLGRWFGTTAPGAFGVGGPEVTDGDTDGEGAESAVPQSETETSAAERTSEAAELTEATEAEEPGAGQDPAAALTATDQLPESGQAVSTGEPAALAVDAGQPAQTHSVGLPPEPVDESVAPQPEPVDDSDLPEVKLLDELESSAESEPAPDVDNVGTEQEAHAETVETETAQTSETSPTAEAA